MKKREKNVRSDRPIERVTRQLFSKQPAREITSAGIMTVDGRRRVVGVLMSPSRSRLIHLKRTCVLQFSE